MANQQLKARIEALAGIAEWNPSDEALQQIAREIATLESGGGRVSRADAARVVLRHTHAHIRPLAGVDTNDVASLLTLAMKYTKR